jgi:hypothetical protein
MELADANGLPLLSDEKRNVAAASLNRLCRLFADDSASEALARVASREPIATDAGLTPPLYSYRSARMGSMALARRAGRKPAPAATAERIARAARAVQTSSGFTP